MTTKNQPRSGGDEAAVTLEELDEAFDWAFRGVPLPSAALDKLDEAFDAVFGPIVRGS